MNVFRPKVGNYLLFSDSIFKVYLLFFFICAIGFVEIFYFNKDLYRNWGNFELDPVAFSFGKKVFLLIVVSLIFINIRKIFYYNVFVIYIFLFFIYSLYLLLISYNVNAAIGAFIKDLTPLLFLIFGFIYRRKSTVIIFSIVYLALINNIIQLAFVYPLQLADVIVGRIPFPGAPFFRASGLVDVAAFEYLNFIAALSCLVYNKNFHSKLFLCFIFCGFLAFQAKSMPVFALLFLVGLWRYQLATLMTICSVFLAFLLVLILSVNGAIFPELGDLVYSLYSDRVERYISHSDSVRTISYKAAYTELLNGNFFGTGLGMFGGPQAILFQSPLYLKYIPQTSELITTDTYYPHVLVEWGLIGFFVFFSQLCLPLFFKFSNPKGKIFYYSILIFILLGNTVTFAYEDVLRGFLIFPLLFISLNLKGNLTDEY